MAVDGHLRRNVIAAGDETGREDRIGPGRQIAHQNSPVLPLVTPYPPLMAQVAPSVTIRTKLCANTYHNATALTLGPPRTRT